MLLLWRECLHIGSTWTCDVEPKEGLKDPWGGLLGVLEGLPLARWTRGDDNRLG